MILDDVYCRLAARDAEIARLEGERDESHARLGEEEIRTAQLELRIVDEKQAAYNKGLAAAQEMLADLRAEVERSKALAQAFTRTAKERSDEILEWQSRAEKAEAEVERLRGACDNACKVGVDASNLVHALQADLTEALAVVRSLQWSHDGHCPICGGFLSDSLGNRVGGHTATCRVGRVLAKSEGGK